MKRAVVVLLLLIATALFGESTDTAQIGGVIAPGSARASRVATPKAFGVADFSSVPWPKERDRCGEAPQPAREARALPGSRRL